MNSQSKLVSTEVVFVLTALNLLILLPIYLNIFRTIFLFMLLILSILVASISLKITKQLNPTEQAVFAIFYVNITNIIYVNFIVIFKNVSITDKNISSDFNYMEIYFRHLIKTSIAGTFLSKLDSILIFIALLFTLICSHLIIWEHRVTPNTLHFILSMVILCYMSLQLYKRRDLLYSSLVFRRNTEEF